MNISPAARAQTVDLMLFDSSKIQKNKKPVKIQNMDKGRAPIRNAYAGQVADWGKFALGASCAGYQCGKIGNQKTGQWQRMSWQVPLADDPTIRFWNTSGIDPWTNGQGKALLAWSTAGSGTKLI
ncbi:unnamed protein product [Penicillium manginii]